MRVEGGPAAAEKLPDSDSGPARVDNGGPSAPAVPPGAVASAASDKTGVAGEAARIGEPKDESAHRPSLQTKARDPRALGAKASASKRRPATAAPVGPATERIQFGNVFE